MLADEINRATPQDTVGAARGDAGAHGHAFGAVTRRLPEPFFVLATQNPIEMEGTYPLPEAQLDRFLFKLDVPAPSEDQLVAILQATTRPSEPRAAPALTPRACATCGCSRARCRSLRHARLAARVVRLTDPQDHAAPEDVKRCVRYGASPRGAQALVLLGRARALQNGRPWVAEEDLAQVAVAALRHRLILSYEGEASGVRADDLVRQAFGAARG